VAGRTAFVALAFLASLARQGTEHEMEVVRVSRADGGRTGRFDPVRVEKNYQKAASDLKQAFSRLERKPTVGMDEGYDAGLPDPLRSVMKTWKPATPLPLPLRGTTIYVVTVDRNGTVHSLPRTPLGRADIVLVSRADRLQDCASVGTVTLLTRPVAESLGIRTSRARCVVSADGAAVEITEGDIP